jgi:hypothetical protein
MQYVLEENDMLHEREPGDGKAQQTVDFGDQIAAGSSSYKDRVIINFRWGSNPDKRTRSGASEVDAPSILCAGILPGVLRRMDWHPHTAR